MLFNYYRISLDDLRLDTVSHLFWPMPEEWSGVVKRCSAAQPE